MGKERLLGISKRGDAYVRCLLIHGARAMIQMARRRTDALRGQFKKAAPYA